MRLAAHFKQSGPPRRMTASKPKEAGVHYEAQKIVGSGVK
jgi:hypothetical protein